MTGTEEKRNTKTESQTKQTNPTNPIRNQAHAYSKSIKTTYIGLHDIKSIMLDNIVLVY